MKNSKINLWLVIALLCVHVGVLAKGGRGSSRSSSSSSRSSGSRSSSSSSGSSWRSSSSSSYGSSRSSYSPSSSSWGSSSRSSSNPSYSSSRSSYSPSSSSWGSSSRSSSNPSYSSSRSSYSPSSSSWGSSSRSSSNPSYSSSRSSYSPSSSSSYSYNPNTASNKSTSGGGIWQSVKNFFGFGSSQSSTSGSSSSSSGSSSSSQSKSIPIPTRISNTSPSHSLSSSSSTSTNQRSSSISGNTLSAHQRFSHGPSESDRRNVPIIRNVTSSASNTLNAPSRLYNGYPALNGTLFNRPSNTHTNISASNVAAVSSLYSAPLSTTSASNNLYAPSRLFNGSPALNGMLFNRPSNTHTNISASNVAAVPSLYSAPFLTTSDSNHNQGSAPSNGRFSSYYGSLPHTHSYHSGSSWDSPTYSSEVNSDNTPNSYYTSSGYSSHTGTASYLPSEKENNDEDSGKSRIQKTCTEILNSEGRISELLKRICSPYAANNNSASTTTMSTPITGIPTEETTISPTTLTPCGYTRAVVQEKNSTNTETPKLVCRTVQQSVSDEHGKLVESIKEICEPATTNTTTIPTICSRPTETTTTTAKPVVEPTFSIILPPTPDVR